MQQNSIYILGSCVIILLIIWWIVIGNTNNESFNIPLRESSAWDWNLGPGYGAGYGTGYAMWGLWPSNLPKEPWKNWMWGRRPLIFTTPYTPVPQIDYNRTINPVSNAEYHYYVSLVDGGIAINGVVGKSLQLDRNRMYFFHVYTPGVPFMFTLDGYTPYLYKPVENGLMEIYFTNEVPENIFYGSPGHGTSGIIYLNYID